MFDAPIVSIIIPVFNTEKYVARCLDSILNQTLTSIEIICIDDGSTDNSFHILEAYAAADSRIYIATQENSGPRETRERGIRIAKGKYIGFVDSDDWIAADMFEKMVKEAERHHCDLVMCDYYKSSRKGITWERTFHGKRLSVKEFMDTNAAPYLCMKLFHSKLKPFMFQGIGKNQAEDVGLLYPLLPHVTKLGYIQEPLYFYYQRLDASTNHDSFVHNYSIDEYLATVQMLFEIDYGCYTQNARQHLVQMIYWGLKSPARSCFRAEYIEFLQKVSPYFVGCSSLKKFADLTQYLCSEMIPTTLICDGTVTEPILEECQESWAHYARHFEQKQIELEGTQNLPSIVQQALQEGKKDFVVDFLKLKYIYENGGIAISNCVKLNQPLGELRSYSSFWGYANQKTINTHIWGAVKGHPLVKCILDSYQEDSIINQTDVGLEMRSYFALCKEYKLSQSDVNEHSLKDGVRVFRCDKLTYKVNRNNVAQVYDGVIRSAEKASMVAAPQEVIEMLIAEARKSEARRKYIASPTEELSFYKNEVARIKNSRSWKLTRPLRKLFNFFRKVKYPSREIE